MLHLNHRLGTMHAGGRTTRKTPRLFEALGTSKGEPDHIAEIAKRHGWPIEAVRAAEELCRKFDIPAITKEVIEASRPKNGEEMRTHSRVFSVGDEVECLTDWEFLSTLGNVDSDLMERAKNAVQKTFTVTSVFTDNHRNHIGHTVGLKGLWCIWPVRSLRLIRTAGFSE